jgi:hypothetical protein
MQPQFAGDGVTGLFFLPHFWGGGLLPGALPQALIAAGFQPADMTVLMEGIWLCFSVAF